MINNLKWYNREIYFKSDFDWLVNRSFCSRSYRFSRHALERMSTRDFTKSNVVSIINYAKVNKRYELFEVKTNEDGTIKEFSLRFDYDNKTNLVCVFCLCDKDMVIKTCYRNSNNDTHKTLNHMRYEKN